MITDREIIARVLAGEIECFRYIVERYQQPVAKLIYFKLHNTCDVEDLTQETFIRAYKYLRSYDQHKSLKNWLLAIAMNLCNSWHRKQVFTIPLKKIFHLKADENISERVLDQEIFLEIKRILQGLPPKQRDVLVLHYLHELTISEIGKLLKIPDGTVKSRLNRGLERLRKTIRELNGRESYEARREFSSRKTL